MLSKVLKAITALLAVALLIILLSTCGTAKSNESKHEYARLMCIERYDDVSIYADTRTGVEYIVCPYKDYYGIAPVLNSDGTPVLAPNFDAREDRPNGT